MRNSLLLAYSILLLVPFACKKQDKHLIVHQLNGSEATIAWQECAFFTDHDITVCIIDAAESRCSCLIDCFPDGEMAATLHITSSTGVDVITTLIAANGIPNNNLVSADTIEGKIVRLVNANLVNADCATEHGNFEKYKFMVTVE